MVPLLFLLLIPFLSHSTAQGPPIFPYPDHIQWGSDSANIYPSFTVTTTSSSSLLNKTIARYQPFFFPFSGTGGTGGVATLDIIVQSDNERLQLGVDESYMLQVDTTGATLSANTVFGAMRGIETFSQLIDFNEYNSTYEVNFLPITIKDAPRFEWRGLMIDTARHYLTLSAILRMIDAASYNKLNTLHWHATDAESFPIQSDKYPLFAEYGAYSPSAYYDSDDIATIVAYALERGVRVVIEFDMPGHAASWGLAPEYRNFTAYCPNLMANINNIPLNPANDTMFDTVLGFLGDILPQFPDEFSHLGGDEVISSCWFQDPDIVKWMGKTGYNTANKIQQYFESKFSTLLSSINKTLVVWQEQFLTGNPLPKNTVVEVWDSSSSLQSVVNAGLRGVVAYPYYLDKQEPKPNSLHYEWVDTWQDFYNSDPAAGVTKNLNNIIGGEAVMFGEQVDAVNIDSRIWPRACGVTERLWSPQSVTNITDAIERLARFRCRLAQRGIGAGPIEPDYCQLPDMGRF